MVHKDMRLITLLMLALLIAGCTVDNRSTSSGSGQAVVLPEEEPAEEPTTLPAD